MIIVVSIRVFHDPGLRAAVADLDTYQIQLVVCVLLIVKVGIGTVAVALRNGSEIE